MLSKLTRTIYSKFSSSDNYHNKQERIFEICSEIDLYKLLCIVAQRTLKSMIKDKKSEKIGKSLFKSGLFLYLSGNNLEKTIDKLNKAIINCKFGGPTFISSYQLRAKCYLKLNNLEQALFDIEVAIRYGSLNKERIIIKTIALVHLKKYSQLKEFIKPEYLEYDYGEFNIPGYEFISKMHLTNCIEKANENISGDNDNDTGNKEENTETSSKHKNYYKFDSRCTIVNDKSKGRYLKATDFIPSGTEILVERCYSLVLENNTRLLFCLFCNEYCGERYIPCRYCKHAIFCNEECFNNAWKLYHRHECLILPLFKDPFNVSLHIYRIIVRTGIQTVRDRLNEFKNNDNYLETEKDLTNSIIDEYLEDEQVRETPDYLQDQEIRSKQYKMFTNLLDHNEKFESYYDLNYMGTAIDVALLLMLNDYLDTQFSDKNIPNWKNFNKDLFYCSIDVTFENISEYIMFDQTYDCFAELVELILLNIRKLSTNVFSWNYYSREPEQYYKKAIATCQCLVASYCNHSCTPNVEWDFKNGFIYYTTVEDVNAGQELNNSYGPHKKMPLIKRQTLLAKNYYFNCCCSGCKEEVNEYSAVLRCLECSGPVVVIPESPINANCMNCSKVYPNAKERMDIINEKRETFQALLHFLRNGQVCETFGLIENLSKSINYQIYYLYGYCYDLQKNILAACEILYRYNLFTYASGYSNYLFDNKTGQCLYKPNQSDLVEIIKNYILWMEIYRRFSRGIKPMFVNQYLPQSTKQFLIQMKSNVQKLMADHNNDEENCDKSVQSSLINLIENKELIKDGKHSLDMPKERNRINYKEFFKQIMNYYDSVDK